MRRSMALALLLLLVAAGIVVNATIFAYRVFEGTVRVVESPTGTSTQLASYGAACAGFYVAPKGLLYDGGVALPPAGSNAQATFAAAGSDLGVRVDLSGVACSWSDASGSGTTYLTATASINVTSGMWYFKDILGFGYPAFSTPSPVYLYIKVEDPLAATNIAEAKLILYDATSGAKVAECNIMTSNALCEPKSITLNSGTGLQIDLWLNATGPASDTFTIGFNVATVQEAPR